MKKRLKFMEKLALQAGKLILSYRNKTNIELKGGATNNFVTDADTETEKFIISAIKKMYPNDTFLAEESAYRMEQSSEVIKKKTDLTDLPNDSFGESAYRMEQSSEVIKKKIDPTDLPNDSYGNPTVLNINKQKGLWIIDPLDGTNNFSRGIPQFCTSIAYAEHGEVLAGCIYDPERDELFSASKGNDAYLNGQKITVSKRNKINETIIATGFYYDRGQIMEQTLKTIHNLFKNNICGIRRLGSAALDLCWVACGRYDAYFEYKLHPWDFAAGMLIVREALGKCYDKSGDTMTLNGEGFIATNTNLEKKFLDLVKID